MRDELPPGFLDFMEASLAWDRDFPKFLAIAIKLDEDAAAEAEREGLRRRSAS